MNGRVSANAECACAERESDEQRRMLQYHKSMNIDYELLGFYDSNPYGRGFTHNLIEDMAVYRSDHEASIALIYGERMCVSGLMSARIVQTR